MRRMRRPRKEEEAELRPLCGEVLLRRKFLGVAPQNEDVRLRRCYRVRKKRKKEAEYRPAI